MSINLGGIQVKARSDGGINFYPKAGRQTWFPMLSVEVTGPHSSDADVSANERNTVCAMWRHLIKGMRPRCTQKCWVKSVIVVSM